MVIFTQIRLILGDIIFSRKLQRKMCMVLIYLFGIDINFKALNPQVASYEDIICTHITYKGSFDNWSISVLLGSIKIKCFAAKHYFVEKISIR